jgi:hypothetical protein
MMQYDGHIHHFWISHLLQGSRTWQYKVNDVYIVTAIVLFGHMSSNNRAMAIHHNGISSILLCKEDIHKFGVTESFQPQEEIFLDNSAKLLWPHLDGLYYSVLPGQYLDPTNELLR